MKAPGKNLELAASDLSRGLLHYGSILGRSSRALVPDLDGRGGRRQEHVQRVRTGEDRRFRTGPGDEAEIRAPFSRRSSCYCTSRAPIWGSDTPVEGDFLPLLLWISGLGTGLRGETACKTYIGKRHQTEGLGREFLRKVCILAPLPAFPA